MRLVDAISLRSRTHKLRLFLEELQPTAETSVLDVGADELGFGESDGCGTLNFFEELYPWPEQITALGLQDGSAFASSLSTRAVRPGRCLRASLRRWRVRHRLLERGDRACGRPRESATLRLGGTARRAARLPHDAKSPLSGRAPYATPPRPLAPDGLSHRAYDATGKGFAKDVHLLSKSSLESLFPGRVPDRQPRVDAGGDR